MGSIADDIKKYAKASAKAESDNGTEGLLIEHALNNLFYADKNSNLESQLVKSVLDKNGYQADRVGLHASAIIVADTKFCLREQVLSLFFKMSQGENLPVKQKRIFEEGNAIHEKWQRLFVRGGIGDVDDMDRSRYVKKYHLTFSPDASPLHICNKDWVCEIKSMNMFAYNKANDHPSGRHQLQLYMHFTGIHNGFILAEDKNTQNFKIFVHHYNYDEVESYIDRLESVKQNAIRFIKEGKMVKRCKQCTSATCKRAKECNMCAACWNVGIGRIRLKEVA